MATARFVPKGTGKTVVGKGRFVPKPVIREKVSMRKLATNAKGNTKYGLQLRPIVENDNFVFGGYGALPKDVLRHDGQWKDYLPKEELQFNGKMEPMACTSFGTTNAIETLIRYIYGEDRNYSDRFLAKMSGTSSGGNDPHLVAETLRNKGNVFETAWSYDEWVDSWAKYYAEIPRQVITAAQAFKAEFDFRHEYVPTTPDALVDALQYSPLGISVYAWVQGDDGLYYKPEGMRENHWCMLYGYQKGTGWFIFDSYDNTHKVMRWDTTFAVAKRYYIKRQANTAIESPWWDVMAYMQSLWPMISVPSKKKV